MPVETLQRIVTLAQNGATVIFEQLPEDVPGYGRLEERRQQFKTTLNAFGTVRRFRLTSLPRSEKPIVAREAIAESGINFIRRSTRLDVITFSPISRPNASTVGRRSACRCDKQSILDPLTEQRVGPRSRAARIPKKRSTCNSRRANP
jgi:hypothetical protein